MAFNILLVDDSLTVRSVIGKALNLAGVEINHIYEAANGEEALAVLDAEWIDLVFCDICMPIMDGEELVVKMNENGLINSVPIVIVSSAGSEPRVKRLMDNGVRDFIQKPFTPERIRKVVDSVLGVASDA